MNLPAVVDAPPPPPAPMRPMSRVLDPSITLEISPKKMQKLTFNPAMDVRLLQKRMQGMERHPSTGLRGLPKKEGLKGWGRQEEQEPVAVLDTKDPNYVSEGEEVEAAASTTVEETLEPHGLISTIEERPEELAKKAETESVGVEQVEAESAQKPPEGE